MDVGKGDSGSNLDLVGFDDSADKSSTESERLPLTQLPAASRRQQRQQVLRRYLLPAMTEIYI